MGAGYDIVVVGAGSAGCVVATRLAERGASVALVEAGPELRGNTPESLRDGWTISPREFDWGYESVPNPRGNTQNVWRTKALGGTSWLTRFAPRGHPRDYDAWGAGWTFSELLPYLKRIERDVDFGDEEWHGSDGPLPVARYLEREYSEGALAQIAAIEAGGIGRVDDHNRPGAVGLGRMPMSTDGGRRVTTLDGYGIDERVALRCDAQVATIDFEGDAATGVRLLDGTKVDAREVVLCAGVYGNPPLLMRSGIGPAADLRSHGIDVRVDLSGVGANLADHPCVDIEGGELAAEPPAEPLHFIATFHGSQTSEDEPPDLMFWGGDPEEAAVELSVVLLKPHSRGRVSLASAHPAAPPRIELPALTEPGDVERLIEGYRRATEVMRACGVEPPAPSGEADLVDWMRDQARSLPHVVGTCAMGEVVDADGRLIGAQGITVADASIIPDVPSGFTQFPTIAIAERLAERIG